jgi:hypothetical protein
LIVNGPLLVLVVDCVVAVDPPEDVVAVELVSELVAVLLALVEVVVE